MSNYDLDDQSYGDIYSSISKTQLIKESKKILKHYEDDFKKDLAVHLYSAHLLHKIDPSFPPRVWTAWPLAITDVPDPKTTSQYVQDPDEIEHELKHKLIHVPKVSKHKKTKITSKTYPSAEKVPNDVLLDELEEELSETNNGENMVIEIDDGDESYESDSENHSDVENVKQFKSKLRKTLNNTTERSDPNENLRIEIDRLFKRKINDKILAQANGKTQPTVDHLHTSEHIYQRLESRLDSIFDQFNETKLSLKAKKKSHLYNWRDIMIASNTKDGEVQKSVNNLFERDSDDYLNDFESRQSTKFSSSEDEDQEFERENQLENQRENENIDITEKPVDPISQRNISYKLRQQLLAKLLQNTNKSRTTDELNYSTYILKP